MREEKLTIQKTLGKSETMNLLPDLFWDPENILWI